MRYRRIEYPEWRGDGRSDELMNVGVRTGSNPRFALVLMS